MAVMSSAHQGAHQPRPSQDWQGRVRIRKCSRTPPEVTPLLSLAE
jgi:hypothetical protein